jgi:hypothetical protein
MVRRPRRQRRRSRAGRLGLATCYSLPPRSSRMYEVAGNGRWSENGDGGTRTHIGLVASEVLFQLSDVPAMKCGRVESNHHSARRRGYSPLSSPVLSVRVEQGRPTGFEPVPRGSRPRMLPLHHSHHVKVSGDDRTRTGGLSPDKRVLSPLSYAPEWRGWDSNPRSRAHEAREDSRSSTALGLAGRSRTCGLRCPRPAGWPTPPQPVEQHPRRDSNPPYRVESPVLRTAAAAKPPPPLIGVASDASAPIDHGGKKLRRQGSNLRFTVNSRASYRSTTPERSKRRQQDSNLRTCDARLRASNAVPSASRPCLQTAEGEGVEPPRPRSPPVFETVYRADGSPSNEKWPRQDSNLHHTD